ncbi:MAG: tRNA (guanosine(46)-N7)-methyltransferase TrmB [Lachnospiraceae bacterium]|nr:tRNA (guanosine(46)-N7)-methyltransferase TrmB [Lachnospiraceae bacterium]
MRLKNIPGSREAIAEAAEVVHEPQSIKGKWPGELYIEIGCGKGRFINTLAMMRPGDSFVGIEKYSSVLIKALDKLKKEPKDNLYLIRMDAEEICEVFAPGEVKGIYLNFSDPWPKDRHAKRRLPGREFLARYAEILAPGGFVEFKTDNVTLFDFALEALEGSAFELEYMTRDLHADEKLMEGNVMTEYEEKFSSMGNPICKYRAVLT